MTVTLNPILQRLAERRPIPVMAHGILEHCLNPAQLDAWFASVAEQQYTRTLLFSAVFDLMTPGGTAPAAVGQRGVASGGGDHRGLSHLGL